VQLWWQYEPGGLIQQRSMLRSAWDVVIPPLRNLRVGRVESYWADSENGRVLWRTLDHWQCDFREGYKTREEAVRELVEKCPRALELIAGRRSAMQRGG